MCILVCQRPLFSATCALQCRLQDHWPGITSSLGLVASMLVSQSRMLSAACALQARCVWIYTDWLAVTQSCIDAYLSCSSYTATDTSEFSFVLRSIRLSYSDNSTSHHFHNHHFIFPTPSHHLQIPPNPHPTMPILNHNKGAHPFTPTVPSNPNTPRIHPRSHPSRREANLHLPNPLPQHRRRKGLHRLYMRRQRLPLWTRPRCTGVCVP